MSTKRNTTGSVQIIRVYDHEAIAPPGAYRVLVDRLWPRGVKKESLEYDDWCKDVTPSADLRKWYGHEPKHWDEFRRRYREELRSDPGSAALAGIAAHSADQPVVLLTAVKDVDISAAAVLAEILKGDAPVG